MFGKKKRCLLHENPYKKIELIMISLPLIKLTLAWAGKHIEY